MSTDYDSLCPTLTPRARRLLRLIATGMTQGQAAMQCGFSQSRACIIQGSTVGQTYLAEMEKLSAVELMEENAKTELSIKAEINQRILEEAPDTLDRIIALRDAAPEAVALRAAQSLMDMAGFKPKEKVEVEGKFLADPGLAEALSRLANASKLASNSSPEGASSKTPTDGEVAA